MNVGTYATGDGTAADKTRFGRKLAGVFIVISLLLAVGAYLYVSHQQSQARLAAHRELTAIADLKLRQISHWREERLSEAHFFSHAGFVARDMRRLLDDPGSEEARSAVLDWLRLLKSGDRYYGVAVFNSQGERCLALPASAGEPSSYLSNLVAKVRQSHEVFMTDLHRDDASGFIHIDLVFPVFENADWTQTTPVGYVLLKLDARKFLFPLVQAWPVPSQTAETVLVRKEGDQVLYLNELRHRRATALALRLPLTSDKLPAAEVLRGRTQVLEGRDYRGVPVVASGRLIPGTSWAMVAKIDRQELYAPLRRQMFAVFSVLGTLLAAGALLVTLVWRQRSARFVEQELAEHKLYEQEMERMNRLYAALSQVNQAVVRAGSRDELLCDMCRALVRFGGCEMAWVGWVDLADSRINPLAQYGDDESYLQRVKLYADERPEGQCLVGAAIREGRPCVCNDLLGDPEARLWQAAGAQSNWRSMAAFPIQHEGQMRGALVVFAAQKDFFGPQEKALIEEAARDVSFGLETLQVQEALRGSEERLRAAALAAEIGVWCWTPGTDQMLVSANWRRLFGVDQELSVTLQRWEDSLHPEDRQRTLRELNSALLEHRDFSSEYRVVRPDGTTAWIVDRGRASYDEQGRAFRMAGVNVDITKRKQAEQALLEARDKLAQANVALERKVEERTAQLAEANTNLQNFAYTAAHDLRAPLRSISSFCSILAEEYALRLGEDGKALLGRVLDSAAQMSRLLNDLLDYSRIEQAEFRLEPVKLREAVAEALELLNADIAARHAHVMVGEGLEEVSGHPATVVMLVGNLLSNALKFVPPNVQPQVHVWGEPRGPGRVRLYVRDNGIGIAPEQLPKLFNPFQRLHAKHEYAGTGLGLAIVRKGAERMGGRAGVESEPGKGSVFWIELCSVSRLSPDITQRAA